MRHLSIGELAERTGVSPETLRAWERRYGLVRPERTSGGHRRYDEHDVARVVHARRLTEQGLPISVAVQRLTGSVEPQDARETAGSLKRLRRAVRQATERLDANAMDAPLRSARDQAGLALTLDEIAVPVLRELGEHWRGSPRKIAREHLTSAVLRSFLIQEIRDVGGQGPICIAACPDREQHELGAIMAAATMAETGWRPLVLGASTPWETIDAVVVEIQPTVLFIGATMTAAGPLVPAGWEPPTQTVVVAGGPGCHRPPPRCIRRSTCTRTATAGYPPPSRDGSTDLDDGTVDRMTTLRRRCRPRPPASSRSPPPSVGIRPRPSGGPRCRPSMSHPRSTFAA